MKRPLVLALSASILALAALAPAVAGSAATWVVDDDGFGSVANCASATPASSTIQAAVTAATAGDTIKVCAGSYVGPVYVDKQLRIIGPHVGKSAKSCPSRANAASVSASLFAFDLVADNIVLDGFRIHSTSYGVHTSSLTSGYLIQNNVIENNSGGVYLNASGDIVSRVRGNCIRDNNLDPSFPTSGTGIYTDQGLENAVISGNGFRRHLNVAINMAETIGVTDTSNVRIGTNNSVNDRTFLSTYGADQILVHRNVIRQNSGGQDWNGSAIYIGGGSDIGGQGSSDVTISENRITSTQLPNGFYAGIAIRASANGVIVLENWISGTFDGVSVTTDAVGGVLVRLNVIKDVHNDGIQALAGTSQNVFSRNRVTGSDNYDCYDETTGTERKGVANTWRARGQRNVGPVSLPSGLCFPS